MLCLTSLPLANGPAWRDRPAVLRGPNTWTWGELHAAAQALAAELPAGGTVCNLCHGRVGFLVGWLAALRQGCLQVLPPSGGPADLAALLGQAVAPVVLADAPQILQPGWNALARCVVIHPERPACDAAPWTPEAGRLHVRLYTSGSTGRPEAQDKTLAQLAQGAAVLGQRLDAELDGGLASLRGLVCSVPPQHMFGLEASVMLALVHGLPCLDERPLLPADVRTAFEGRDTGDERWAWITTPLHLRALARAGESLPHCGLALASTMPLAPGIAAQAEALVDAPVLEIYGSTETGAVALRRTAHEPLWRALPGVALSPVAEGTEARGSHFTSPRTLADRIEPQGEAGFRLLGRQADLIKIAGRRASLAGLNLLLQDLPGLDDGVFYLPESSEPAERLVLIHAGAPLDRAAALAWLRERLDPAFLPRAFIHVDALPRSGPGKLARAALDALYAQWVAQRRAP